ncbi:HAMP domain-containing histidine kinase [Ruminococcus sp. CLA-AA-H200]|uniref:histidine kinase n=1 Tax=Ruminococcus turbiniformis TaxID=2881258 RepID=A0ABS8FSS9_9FIRM|nr:HAMP domain-containing sensor histidine kinase [Ruminococcus turbiniformis]MCC2253036.1 HAMP domain-containing histidine kinase [Ruminococcus turbiniformis]
MAIKWENTAEKAKHFLKEQRRAVIGGVLLVCGFMLLFTLIQDHGSYITDEALTLGVFANAFAGAGNWIFTGEMMKRKSGGWIPDDEESYGQWREKRKRQERRLCIVGGAGLLLAFWYMSYLMDGGVYTGGWYWNYASGYVAIFTAVFQFIVTGAALERFWREQLDSLMDQAAQINRRRVEAALEIERKSLEKVSRSDQLRVDLITNVSHDLKTPLTSIVGYLELIRKEELSDVVRDYVDVISERAEKLKEMINSLFSLAKASSGNVELHPERFELNRMIEQIFADMDDRIRESRLEFVTQLSEENTELVSDNTYFYRICQNLVENALKYSAKGTRVFVKTYVKGADSKEKDLSGKLCLEITNTSGYPMDFTKEDIVERFARGDKARSGDGNGLGLAIVSTYVKALGGEFDIRIDCDQFKACIEMPRDV